MANILIKVENQVEYKSLPENQRVNFAPSYKSCLESTKPAALLLPGECVLLDHCWYTIISTKLESEA